MPRRGHKACISKYKYSDDINKTLQIFAANANKHILDKKRQIAHLAQGAAEIYRTQIDDVHKLEAEKWSECQQSLQQQCEPVLDNLSKNIPSIEKSGLILLKAVSQKKALLQEVSKHHDENVKQLRDAIKQFKKRRENDAVWHTEQQKKMADTFTTQLLKLRQEIMQKTQDNDVEKIKAIMKNTYSA